MRKFVLALAGAALFALPTSAFSQSVVVGPGGIQIEPYHYGHHYARSIHGGGQCRELKSWANKVRETANGIAKCARNSFAIPLPTGRFMHDVGTVEGGQDVTFTRAGVIGSGPSACPPVYALGFARKRGIGSPATAFI